MSYIERKDIEEMLENAHIVSDGEYCGYCTDDIDLYSIPTADVVEVVRCKDCKFSREMDKYEKKLYFENCVGCTMHSTSYHSVIMRGNDFCSYGDRKD